MSPDELNQGPPDYQDIEILMTQTGCTMNEAIDAMAEANNDLAKAILIVTNG